MIDEKAVMRGVQGLTVLQNGYSIMWALGQMVERGEQKKARLWIKRMFKRFANNGLEGVNKDVTHLVLDEFFNTDGDMSKAADKVLRDLKENCPDFLWAHVEETLQSARENALEKMDNPRDEFAPHKHKCECGNVWEHSLNPNWTSKEFCAAHKCSKCGKQMELKTEDCDD